MNLGKLPVLDGSPERKVTWDVGAGGWGAVLSDLPAEKGAGTPTAPKDLHTAHRRGQDESFR